MEKETWKPVIYDTTLREGMQTPDGVGGNMDERVYAANNIARFSDWVELGMPANDVDYRIIETIKASFLENSRDVGIAVLCRNKKIDIDRAEEVLEGYSIILAHLFIGTSGEHRSHRFKGKWTKEDYIENIESMVHYAAEKPFTRIMFSPEDSFRTFEQSEEDFFDFVDAAIRGYEKGSQKQGRKEKFVLNFPDTVGKSTISKFNHMLDKIIKRYGDSIEISLHGHDDSATSIPQAVEAFIGKKANWLQTTFGGMGERNGIASTEGVISILKREELLKGKKYSDENLKELVPATRAILGALGRSVPAEAIVSGYRVNVSTAGIHTDIAMKEKKAYHIYGDSFGADLEIEFGATSGANQIIPIIEKIGFKVEKTDPKVGEFTNLMKERCNKDKRALKDTEIMYYAVHHFRDIEDPLKVDNYSVMATKTEKSEVSLFGSYRGKRFEVSSTENGVIEAVISNINKIFEKYGKGKIKLMIFRPQVIPKIAEEFLSWKKGEYPKIPKGLDVRSDLRAITGISDAERNGIVYYGFASEEDSLKTIIDSVIDAAVKMETVKKWKENN